MKRYFIFAGDTYYPCGGWDDFNQCVDTVAEAWEVTSRMTCDWWIVVDSQTGEVIKRKD